ncbi:hypothetical protein F5Y16DRAFT_415801 [Xylariaceae sp. FL0255]|nr:hypothetical protein F5Y16DRAFT_415801 [Xylariaceae sp. FL0255]
MADYPTGSQNQVLNKLLKQALAGSEALVPNSEHELAIIDTSEDGSSKLPETATKPPLDDTFRAFIARSLEDAAKHVGDAHYFALIDNRSGEDDTTLLVCCGQEDGALETVRTTFKSVQTSLVSLGIASLGFNEIQSIAGSQGGVYGRPTTTPQRGGPAPRMRLGGGS